MSAHAARISRPGEARALAATLGRVASDSWLAMAIAGAIIAICFGATGGLESLGPGGVGLVVNTTLQMALTLGGGLLLAVACAQATGPRARVWGVGCAVAFLALAALTAVSIVGWVDPANSWIEASRTFAYVATFVGAIALVRLGTARWRSVIAGVLVATVVVSAYALASRVIPESIDAADVYARVSSPFG